MGRRARCPKPLGRPSYTEKSAPLIRFFHNKIKHFPDLEQRLRFLTLSLRSGFIVIKTFRARFMPLNRLRHQVRPLEA